MLDSHARQYTAGSSFLWFPILTFLFTLVAAIIAVIALIQALGGSNSGLHTNFVSTTYNITLAGICDAYPIDVIIGKIGAEVTVEIPPFLCDGTANVTDPIGGVRFTMPSGGYDSDILFHTGASSTYPRVAEFAVWCTGGPNVTACSLYNHSIAYIVGGVFYMGRSTTQEAFLAPSLPYGPLHGFSLKYFTPNYTAALVTSDTDLLLPTNAMTMLAIGTALGLVVIP